MAIVMSPNLDYLIQGPPAVTALTLGLTVNMSSVGWCVIDEAAQKIVDLGAHRFPETVKRGRKAPVTTALIRRQQRLSRRRLERARARRRHCLALLRDYGLVPEDADESYLQLHKGDRPILALRALGLDSRLTDRELAQVIYCLNKHRGYIPHGEGDVLREEVAQPKRGAAGEVDEKAAERGKVIGAIKANDERMALQGWRTVGEMMYHSADASKVAGHRTGAYRNKAGDYSHCVTHAQVLQEVHALLEAQRRLGNALLTDGFERDLRETMSWERKTTKRDKDIYERQVGYCTYFPGERRAARACLSAEMLAAYAALGNLVMVNAEGQEDRLTAAEVDRFMCVLFSAKPSRVTYAIIRKSLALPDDVYFKGVEAAKEADREPYAPRAWRSFSRALGTDSSLLASCLEDRSFADALLAARAYASSDESLVNRSQDLLRQAGYDRLDDVEREELLSVPYRAPVYKGYGSRSLKAIEMLLGAFEEDAIITLAEAERASGLDRQRLSHGLYDRSMQLPPYGAFDPACSNPNVLHVMANVRRVVNSLVRAYGLPATIKVEVSNELKSTKRDRMARARTNRVLNERHAASRRHIAKLLGIATDEVFDSQVERYELMRQQGGVDLYTGRPIDERRVLTDESYAQIGHILPYSRTLDGSHDNRALCVGLSSDVDGTSNQYKGDRTPHEWMASGEATAPSWEAFARRVMATESLTRRKRDKLLDRGLEAGLDSGYLRRQLADRRYASRCAQDYLSRTLAWEDDSEEHVVVVSSMATSKLGYEWGLIRPVGQADDMGEDSKVAVAAAIVAACGPATLRRLAHEHSRPRASRVATNSQPWPSFAIEVRLAQRSVTCSRQLRRRLRGAVTEDTIRGLRGRTEKGKMLVGRKGDRDDSSKWKPLTAGYVMPDGVGVKNYGGHAFARLWHDEVAGTYYAEPVFYFDLPSAFEDDYVPRYPRVGLPREQWPEVPAAAMARAPILLFTNALIRVNHHVGRFRSLDISNGCVRTDNPMIPRGLTKWHDFALLG